MHTQQLVVILAFSSSPGSTTLRAHTTVSWRVDDRRMAAHHTKLFGMKFSHTTVRPLFSAQAANDRANALQQALAAANAKLALSSSEQQDSGRIGGSSSGGSGSGMTNEVVGLRQLVGEVQGTVQVGGMGCQPSVV